MPLYLPPSFVLVVLWALSSEQRALTTDWETAAHHTPGDHAKHQESWSLPGPGGLLSHRGPGGGSCPTADHFKDGFVSGRQPFGSQALECIGVTGQQHVAEGNKGACPQWVGKGALRWSWSLLGPS